MIWGCETPFQIGRVWNSILSILTPLLKFHLTSQSTYPHQSQISFNFSSSYKFQPSSSSNPVTKIQSQCTANEALSPILFNSVICCPHHRIPSNPSNYKLQIPSIENFKWLQNHYKRSQQIQLILHSPSLHLSWVSKKDQLPFVCKHFLHLQLRKVIQQLKLCQMRHPFNMCHMSSSQMRHPFNMCHMSSSIYCSFPSPHAI